MSLEQGKEFKNVESGTMLENMFGKLSSLVTLQRLNVQESLQNMHHDDNADHAGSDGKGKAHSGPRKESIKELRGNLEDALDKINGAYEQEVLHNSKLIDDFDKKVDSQRKEMVDNLKAKSFREDKVDIKSLDGRLEDSGTFVRLGNIRYVIFAIIAIAIISFTMHHSNINTTGYVVVSMILGATVVFIINFIQQESIRTKK